VFYWVMKRIFIGPLLKMLFRPWVKGMQNIPDDGPAILASNHLSFSDSIFLPVCVPRPVVFLAKSEYFTGKGLKGKLTAMFFRLTNQLPMDRSGGAASATSLDAGIDVLKKGGLLGIYPEGTRSPDGRLYRGKTGIAKLALATGVPVIPVAMIGTDKVQPIGRRIPNIRRLGIIIGEPMDFSRYQGLENDRFVQRSVADEIMYGLMRLSGQEYADVYASTVKDRLASRKGGKAADGGKSSAVRAKPPAVKKPGTVTTIGPTNSSPANSSPANSGKAAGDGQGADTAKVAGADPATGVGPGSGGGKNASGKVAGTDPATPGNHPDEPSEPGARDSPNGSSAACDEDRRTGI
jgi:1-acyl-sn-glycerol-3-phosphate acyltransferase